MGLKFSNRAKTTLAGAIGSGDTSISVASSASFPSLSAGDYFYATIVSADTLTTEIIKVTAVSGTTWTVVRGQDGTSAAAWSSGLNVEGRVVAALLTDLIAGSGGSVTISTTAPSSPSAGDLWWNSDSGVLKIYYNDGNSSQWVDASTGPMGPQGPAGPSTTINNTLTSTSTTEALSANMGKQLQDTKQKNITYGTADPTGGSDGDIYLKYTP